MFSVVVKGGSGRGRRSAAQRSAADETSGLNKHTRAGTPIRCRSGPAVEMAPRNKLPNQHREAHMLRSHVAIRYDAHRTALDTATRTG